MSRAEEGKDFDHGIPEKFLGYWRDPRWRDMSDFVVHFTTTLDRLLSIISEGLVRPSGPFGRGMKVDEVAEKHLSACFSEIPLDLIDRLMARHGRYGVGFAKKYLVESGGARVWYVDKYQAPDLALFDLVGDLLRAKDFENRLWSLTPFIDTVVESTHEFEWEREWRVPEGLEFRLEDVAFVILFEGGQLEIVEKVTVGAPVVNRWEDDPHWIALPDALASEMDRRTAAVLEKFVDPVEYLYWDDGDYVWPVQKYSSEMAVDEVHERLEPKLREELVEYLDNISPDWIRLSEYRELDE